MSNQSQHDIACPFCGHEQTVELWDVLNVDEQPELREWLLASRINRVECAGCRKSFRVDKALAYHDRGRSIYVHFEPAGPRRPLAEIEKSFGEAMTALGQLLPADIRPPVVHLVVEWGELIERIFLLEAGLDARLIEHIKYLMYRRNPEKLPASRKNLLFDAQDSTAEQLCFIVQDRSTRKLEALLTFARADYEELRAIFAGGTLLTEQFPGAYWSGRWRFLQDQAET